MQIDKGDEKKKMFVKHKKIKNNNIKKYDSRSQVDFSTDSYEH